MYIVSATYDSPSLGRVSVRIKNEERSDAIKARNYLVRKFHPEKVTVSHDGNKAVYVPSEDPKVYVLAGA